MSLVLIAISAPIHGAGTATEDVSGCWPLPPATSSCGSPASGPEASFPPCSSPGVAWIGPCGPVVMEAYVSGASTRKVDDLVAAKAVLVKASSIPTPWGGSFPMHRWSGAGNGCFRNNIAGTTPTPVSRDAMTWIPA